MQLTPAQRRFYIDPVQDPTIITDTLLVTEERSSRGVHMDTIVTVRKDRYASDSRQWWITEGGDYVAGAPVNPSGLLSYQRVIGIGGDGWFWHGTPSRRVTGGYLCSGLRRSDGRQLPGIGNTGPMSMEIPEVVKAAPWASTLFPVPGDSDAVIRAKLDLAEQRWNHRRAKAEIIRQGMTRGWSDDLKELRESGKLPTATFGAFYKGTVMIEAMNPPAADSISVRDNARLQELRDRVKVPGSDGPKMMLGLEVNMPLTVQFDEYENTQKISADQLKDHIRQAVGDYTAVPGEHYLTPVLRSVA